jgi:isopentenyl-diphosphate Delta-isomerase
LSQVILVNEADIAIGEMDKMEAHQKGLLHRAFSIFIFNDKKEWLLQQRADTKYHSGGLWTNTCCSHPSPGEDTATAAQRRLEEEMGFRAPIKHAFSFIYKTVFDNQLTEYEFDHVFVGHYEGPVQPDQKEVKDHTYKPVAAIREELAAQPQRYTSWFKIAFPKLEEYLAAASA